MKNLSFTLLLSLLGTWAGAQCTVNANAVAGITLQCDNSQGQANRSAVAYNPGFDLYYSVDAGSTSYPIETFDGSGTPLADVAQGFDYRGMWWNPNTNRLEGNGYGAQGVAYQNLNIVDGHPLGTVTNIFSAAQPDMQSDGDYDYDDNEIVYYYNGAYHRYDGATNAPLGTVALTGLPVTTGNLNSNSAFYTGCAGKEYGVYDYVNKAFYFIDKATGAYVVTSQLPVTAPAASQFQASYANGKLWLFNGTDFKWYSYEVLQPCTPPAATITASGPTTFCDGGSVVLNANTGMGLTYQWQESGADIAGATSASFTAMAAGDYTVVVTENSCDATSAEITVTVNQLPAVVTTPSGNIIICEGSSGTIEANNNINYTYQWIESNLPLTGETNAAIIVSTPGNFTVQISDGVCMDTSAVVNVTVSPLPVPAIMQSGNQLSTSTFSSYQWLLNNIVIPGATNQEYTFTQPGSYTVIVTDANGCSDTSVAYTPVSVTNTILTELNVYPNPSSGTFLIKGHVSNQSNKATMKITDITGRTIKEDGIEVKNSIIEKQVSLSELSAGTYLLFIMCDNERQVIPLTIN